ncbi:hypothetical protein ACWGI8_00460 [Streptomyces sp. NPDC054841]
MMFDAPPTQKEIKTAKRLAEEYQAATPSNEEEASVLARRIYEDWQAVASTPGRTAAPDLLSFIRDIGEHGSVTAEDRGTTRAFWSYESRPEGEDRKPIQHRFLARACGASRGLQVLQETEGGRQMDSYRLEGELVPRILEREYGVDGVELKSVVDQAWVRLSERYAEAAQGPVVAFVPDIAERTVLGQYELPILLAHPKVGKEGVKFPIPMPEHKHLPPEIDALIADQPLRAQIRMEDFDLKASPKDFAAKLADLDVPENQREAHESALWRLAAANSYDELVTRAVENQTLEQKGSAFTPGVTERPVSRPAAPRGPTGHGVYNLTVEPPAPALVPAQTGVER